jgi:SAM-dependent methyltransferase
MIIHRLVWHHLRHGDDLEFYRLQALDAIAWMQRQGVRFGAGRTVLDLGCGHGVFGAALRQRQCEVTFADAVNCLPPDLAAAPFRQFDIDREEPRLLGRYDVVICSNVLEHLAKPDRLLAGLGDLLASDGVCYLSWTNWLSPWGGHEFSPFHYLGARRGHRVYDRLVGKPRKHTPFVNLFPTSISQVLRQVRRVPSLRLLAAAPRYYTELAGLLRIPVLREFVAWNCALLLARR